MKRILIIIILIVIIILMAIFGGLYINSITEDLSISQNNVKALQNEKITLVQNVEQLKSDSTEIGRKLREVCDSLKIKPKTIVEYKYTSEKAERKDSISFKEPIFNDEVFKDNECIDTTITDGKWYELEISLNYPNLIIVQPTFTSEKYLISHSRKETINPPRKFFLFRWFQKKHTIVETEVVELNPYIQTKDYKFVDIIK